MADERTTNEDLADELEMSLAVDRESRGVYAAAKTLREAARRLREMDKGIVSYPDNITTQWLDYISGVKHEARAKGETSLIHHLTSVESILEWWERDIRPTLIIHEPQEQSE